MGCDDQRLDWQADDAVSAERALRRLFPAIGRAARHPERYTARQRTLLVELVNVALLSRDDLLLAQAATVVVDMEGENQKRDQRDWPMGT